MIDLRLNEAEIIIETSTYFIKEYVDNGILIVKVNGSCSLLDIQEMTFNSSRIMKKKSISKLFIDLTYCNFQISISQIYTTVIDAIKRYAAGTKAAILVHKSFIAQPKLNFLSYILLQHSFSAKIFTDEEQAIIWLENDGRKKIIHDTLGFAIPETMASGEYNGSALQSFLEASPLEWERDILLNQVGLESIDPNKWYPLDVARKLYYGVEAMMGSQSLMRVGKAIIENAKLPDPPSNPKDALTNIQKVYQMIVRGTGLGEIVVNEIDSDTISLVFSTPFPCLLDQGMIMGCASIYGKTADIEHIGSSCRDKSSDHCVYIVDMY